MGCKCFVTWPLGAKGDYVACACVCLHSSALNLWACLRVVQCICLHSFEVHNSSARWGLCLFFFVFQRWGEKHRGSRKTLKRYLRNLKEKILQTLGFREWVKWGQRGKESREKHSCETITALPLVLNAYKLLCICRMPLASVFLLWRWMTQWSMMICYACTTYLFVHLCSCARVFTVSAGCSPWTHTVRAQNQTH